jgi:hypothetical protein
VAAAAEPQPESSSLKKSHLKAAEAKSGNESETKENESNIAKIKRERK